jgi:hypothetical protein
MYFPDQIVRIVAEIAVWFVFVPFILVLYRLFYQKRSPMLREQKILSGYLILAVVTELIAKILGDNGLSNLPVLHIYTIVQFFLVALFYQPDKRAESHYYIWLSIVVLFISASIINSLYVQSIWVFNGYALATKGLIIVLFAIIYFGRLLFGGKTAVPLLEVPMFWISTGMLFYFSACFFVFLLSGDVLLFSSDVFRVSWAFHDIMLIVHYLFLIVALWPTRQPTPYTSPSLRAH